MGYKEDLKIDSDALDIECLRQPSLFMEYSELCAEARLEMDKKKERVEVVRAEIDSAIRTSPKNYITQDVKVTETSIAGTVVRQPEYRDAVKDYIEAKNRYELLNSVVKAFEQRKSTLEYLIRLHGQQYFSGPDSPRDLKGEYGKFMQKTKKEIVRDKIKRAMNSEEK